MNDDNHFERVFRTLGRSELQKGGHGLQELGLEDLFGAQSDLFLGFYTEDGIRTALERYGVFEELAQQGYTDARVEARMDDADAHMLRFWSDTCPADPLMELVVHRGTLRPEPSAIAALDTDFLNVLWVEWLQLQNPRRTFSEKRPPLPGQNFPGLGVGASVMELLHLMCKRLHLDGLITTPSYFHNALFYTEAFQYFDPHVQGIFLALRRDVTPQTFGSPAAASWAFVWKLVNRLQDGEEEPFEWFHDAQVAPVSPRLKQYFETADYATKVQEGLRGNAFRVDAEQLANKLEEHGVLPFDADRAKRLTNRSPDR